MTALPQLTLKNKVGKAKVIKYGLNLETKNGKIKDKFMKLPKDSIQKIKYKPKVKFAS